MTTKVTEDVDESQTSRHVAAVFQKYERDMSECQELLCQATSHWLLSTDEPVSRAAAAGGGGGGVTSGEPPPGVITNLTALPQSRVILLVPTDDTDVLDMREVLTSYYFLV